MQLRSSASGGVLGFDLENRPLAYWYDGETTSEITAFGWKWVGEDAVKWMLRLRNDRFLCEDGRKMPPARAYARFLTDLSSAALVFGHNIRRHDLPMLQAGLDRLQMPKMRPVLTCDTLKDLPRSNGRARSLEALAYEYELGGEKVSMPVPAWEQANKLIPEGVERARDRVVGDVLLQERLRAKLLDLCVLKPPRMWVP
jgi:hypothetical protein